MYVYEVFLEHTLLSLSTLRRRRRLHFYARIMYVYVHKYL